MRIKATITHQASFVSCQSSLLQHLAAHVRETEIGIFRLLQDLHEQHCPFTHACVPDSCAVCWWPARHLLWRNGVSHFRTIHSNSS